MLSVVSYRDPLLINTVGHAVGVLLFGVMALLLLKDWRHNGVRQTRLSLAAALLALFWNGGSLMVLASSGCESRLLEEVVSFSFSVLSVLPAVLLHLVLGHRKHWPQKTNVDCRRLSHQRHSRISSFAGAGSRSFPVASDRIDDNLRRLRRGDPAGVYIFFAREPNVRCSNRNCFRLPASGCSAFPLSTSAPVMPLLPGRRRSPGIMSVFPSR